MRVRLSLVVGLSALALCIGAAARAGAGGCHPVQAWTGPMTYNGRVHAPGGRLRLLHQRTGAGHAEGRVPLRRRGRRLGRGHAERSHHEPALLGRHRRPHAPRAPGRPGGLGPRGLSHEARRPLHAHRVLAGPRPAERRHLRHLLGDVGRHRRNRPLRGRHGLAGRDHQRERCHRDPRTDLHSVAGRGRVFADVGGHSPCLSR